VFEPFAVAKTGVEPVTSGL